MITKGECIIKSRKKEAKTGLLQPDWKGLLKSNENSVNLSYLFHPQPTNLAEKSTTHATLDSMNSLTINFEGNSNERSMNPGNSSNKFVERSHPFRRLSFEEELEFKEKNGLEEERNDKKPGFSRQTVEILQTLRAKQMDLEHDNHFSLNNQKLNTFSSYNAMESFKIKPENYGQKTDFFNKTQGISKSTEEIIKQIKAKSSLNDQNKTLNQEFDVRNEKIPTEYRRIITKFETLENALVFMGFRKTPTFFLQINDAT